MAAYAIAHLNNPHAHTDIVDYLERIQDTLDPYGGRFLVHGAQVEVREGDWPGTLVMIAFPDLASARDWYDSAAYQSIRHLRTDHIDGATLIVDGVPADYHPAGLAAGMRAMLAASPSG
jgi:uncharacterized protein (DUF1330 family)